MPINIAHTENNVQDWVQLGQAECKYTLNLGLQLVCVNLVDLFSPDMHGRLDTISSNIDDHISRLQDLQAHSTKLGHDLQLEQSSVPQPDDHTLPSLRQELQSRLQEGNALAALLSEKERELQAVKVMLEVYVHSDTKLD